MSDKEEDFTRVFTWVLAALVLFTIVVMLLARSVGMNENSGPMTDKDIDARTMPYGAVKVADTPEAEPAVAPSSESAAAAPATAEPAPASALVATEEITIAAAAPVIAGTAIDGQALYPACAICHAAGVAGAPMVGDTAAWAPRIAAGMDALVANAINGKFSPAGAMPPKGGRPDLSDAEIKAIVEYMVTASK